MNSESAQFSSGLALINNYSSEDENSSEEVESSSTQKNSGKEKLPLPAQFLTHSTQYSEEHVDDTSAHDGRIRSFPHQRGNWATYIFIPFDATELYDSFVDIILENVDQSLGLKIVQEPHISLTHTVILLHHWIDSFVKTVEQQLKHVASFDITFGSLSAYTNKEKTRTFIGLDVAFGVQEIFSIVNILNACLKEFNLATFYEVPSFHVSFAWCLGDQKKSLEGIIPHLQICFQQFAYTHSEISRFNVSNCCCKTGNKLFNFKLKSL